jgi:hypothetical protein
MKWCGCNAGPRDVAGTSPKSGSPSKADIRQCDWLVRFVPITDISPGERGGPPSRFRNLADLAWKSPSHHTKEQGLPISIGVSACCEDVTNHVAAYVLAEIQSIFI